MPLSIMAMRCRCRAVVTTYTIPKIIAKRAVGSRTIAAGVDMG